MPEARRVLRIAHRGASGTCPENTRAAFVRAIELGADMIELDCQLSADGAIVVMHDDTVDRTTDGKGAVADLTLAALKALDAGSWFGPRFAGEEIPTLEEVYEITNGRVSLNVELKVSGEIGRLELQTLGVVSSFDALETTVFSSFRGGRMRKIRELSDEARVGILLENGRPAEKAFAIAKEIGAEAIHPELSLIDEAWVVDAHGRGLSVRAWPVNEREDLEHVIRSGVDGVFTDYPDRLLRVVV